MKDHVNAIQVGAPDPDRNNSQIVEDTDYEYSELGQLLTEVPACYFNDISYADGSYVCSGNELLKCMRGTWVRTGSCDPDNP
jgi:hypothetical protein